jgi:cation diffusion facilitator family transporter
MPATSDQSGNVPALERQSWQQCVDEPERDRCPRPAQDEAPQIVSMKTHVHSIPRVRQIEYVPKMAAGTQPSTENGEESARTVIIALLANLAVAVAKGVAAAITGSAAMLAETAHSIADTMNEVFLVIGVRRSRRSADDMHPHGYGEERYFWSLLAAIGVFVAGGVVAIHEGVEGLLDPHPVEFIEVGLAVLAVSAVLEGTSWRVARRQLRADAGRRGISVRTFVRSTSDPAPVTVFFEDSAALIGLGLAAAGLILHAITGAAVWDALASLAVGVLLIWVAYRLVVLNRNLLIGVTAPPAIVEELVARVAAENWVRAVPSSTVMFVGPHRVSAAFDVVVADGLPSAELAARIDALRDQLRSDKRIVSVTVTPTTISS